MTPSQHISKALSLFALGANAYHAVKPFGVSYARWHRRLYKAAHRRGVVFDLMFRNWGDDKTVLIKPRPKN
jgi:hypothetical protein